MPSQLARAKEREANARRDWLHKVSRRIVLRFDRIVLEALRVRAMAHSAKGTLEQPGMNVRAKAGLNRALLDAGFGMLATLIREKAACAARTVIEVDADVNAARVILLRAESPPMRAPGTARGRRYDAA